MPKLRLLKVFGMMGNEVKIAIGMNNLIVGDGQVGVTSPFVIRQV
jgi:hypothetical protein